MVGMMMMHSCSGFCPKYHPLQKSDCKKTLQFPAQVHGVLKRSPGKKYTIKFSEKSFYSANKIIRTGGEDVIRTKKYKPFSNNRVPVTFRDGDASTFKNDSKLMRFLDAFLKSINAIYRFTRPYALVGNIFETISICVLPLQQLADLNPTTFIGILMAMSSGLLMAIHEVGINQLYDVEIDKINKPDLPLASGDLSMGAGIAITCTSVLMSMAIAIMARSPPLFLGNFIWFLCSSAYSVDLPFLRWKRNSYLTAMYLVIEGGLAVQFGYFMHVRKYVLGRPMAITRTLMFSVIIKSFFMVAIAFLKDIPDEDGDRESGIQTLSLIIGKERVLYVGVYTLLMAYGAAIIVGTSSPFLLSKLVTIISHSVLASLLWRRTRNVDLSDKASTLSFYMFIWKLLYVEYLLIPFVRL